MRTITACVVAASIICLAGLRVHADDVPLLEEGYETDLALKVPIHGANQPYTAHEIGITTERAHTGTHCVKIDVTYMHGLDICLAPRSNETPSAEWGSVGGPGWFVFKGLGLPLQPDRGYLLTLWVWVEKATGQSPVGFAVETDSNSDCGIIHTQTPLDAVFPAPTKGWVKVEQELTSTTIAQMDGAGACTEGLRLATITLNTFGNLRDRITAYVDDVSLREVPMSVAAELRAKRQADRAARAPVFRRCPQVENLFVWGAYGGLTGVSPEWFRPLEKGRDARTQEAERLRRYADATLLDLRRHYCNAFVQGGGMLFPSEGQSAYDYVQACLDKCAEYGVRLAPSTYLSQLYSGDLPRAKCEQAMRKATAMWRDHPGLLGCWLVDEPQPAMADDLYWGKRTMEALDPNHPVLSACNCLPAVGEFAPTLPIAAIDYYPISPIPSADKGAWAVGDSVRYARALGAKRVWLLPPVFGQNCWRNPSAQEFTLQVFAGIAEGCTGVLPYAYCAGAGWYNPSAEYGDLVDPYGNPSPSWDAMRRLGPYLRSAGALLAGAERLPDEAIAAPGREVTVTNVGRKRPVIVARMFADPVRHVRYIVAYNNTLAYRWQFTPAIQTLNPGEKLLDLFALRDTPLTGNTFAVFLEPADGRIYALGQPQALQAVKSEVLASRFGIEGDLTELEGRVARRMGTDVAPVAQALLAARASLAAGKPDQALTQLADATGLLDRLQRANAAYWSVHEAVEDSRASLGHINQMMSRRIAYGANDYPREDPAVKARTDRMIALSDRFYTLQSDLLRQGPKGLASDATRLRDDVQAFERSTLAFFGA